MISNNATSVDHPDYFDFVIRLSKHGVERRGTGSDSDSNGGLVSDHSVHETDPDYGVPYYSGNGNEYCLADAHTNTNADTNANAHRGADLSLWRPAVSSARTRFRARRVGLRVR